MTDFEKCTTVRFEEDGCVAVSCKLGFWGVKGRRGEDVFLEAHHYFQQYKSDGEYHEIIGGRSPHEIMMLKLSLKG